MRSYAYVIIIFNKFSVQYLKKGRKSNTNDVQKVLYDGKNF